MTTATATAASTYQEELATVRGQREEGLSWGKIAEDFSITRQAVYARYSADTSDILSVSRSKARLDEVSVEITSYLEDYGPFTKAHIMEKYDVTASEYTRLEIPKYLVIAPSKKATQHWSETQIRQQLNRANKETVGPILTSQAYLAWYDNQPKGSVISLPGLHVRYGSWIAAVSAAGVKHGRKLREYSRGWDKEDILRIISTYVEMCVETGVRVTYAGYDAEQKKHADWPSGSTARNSSGLGWSALIAASAQY